MYFFYLEHWIFSREAGRNIGYSIYLLVIHVMITNSGEDALFQCFYRLVCQQPVDIVIQA